MTLTNYLVAGALGFSVTIVLYHMLSQGKNDDVIDNKISDPGLEENENENQVPTSTQPVDTSTSETKPVNSGDTIIAEKRSVHSLIIGCNYPNTTSTLNGCVPDGYAIYNIFKSYSEQDSQFMAPLKMFDVEMNDFTKERVMSKLREMYNGCKPGDTFFLYFSGHGIQIIDWNQDERFDAKDECCLISCATDQPMEWLLDDDLAEFFNKKDVKFVFLLDCCHSGGMSDIVRGRENNLVISACTEHQTSKEVGMYNTVRGIFTSNLETILKTMTKDQNINQIKKNSIWNSIDKKYTQTITVWGNPDVFQFPVMK